MANPILRLSKKMINGWQLRGKKQDLISFLGCKKVRRLFICQKHLDNDIKKMNFILTCPLDNFNYLSTIA